MCQGTTGFLLALVGIRSELLLHRDTAGTNHRRNRRCHDELTNDGMLERAVRAVDPGVCSAMPVELP